MVRSSAGRNLPVINDQFNSLQHRYIGQQVAGNHNQIGFVPPSGLIRFGSKCQGIPLRGKWRT
jgi:hypothetical protein